MQLFWASRWRRILDAADCEGTEGQQHGAAPLALLLDILCPLSLHRLFLRYDDVVWWCWLTALCFDVLCRFCSLSLVVLGKDFSFLHFYYV